ncbi:unnamed protein product [Linum trigynum]|uniref:Uncharacterized protein n=1 Tax=Linum trigynum TaxID=586398 RepID=A0AAV2G9U0_9ROSI
MVRFVEAKSSDRDGLTTSCFVIVAAIKANGVPVLYTKELLHQHQNLVNLAFIRLPEHRLRPCSPLMISGFCCRMLSSGGQQSRPEKKMRSGGGRNGEEERQKTSWGEDDKEMAV